MKTQLVLEDEEKAIIKKAAILIEQYCDESDCDKCPLDDLCTKLNKEVPYIFISVQDTLC